MKILKTLKVKDLFIEKIETKPKYYFYGDRKKFEKIYPTPSPVIDNEKAVFSTNERWLALVFIATFKDSEIEIGFINEKPYLMEMEKNAFKRFLNVKGYLYTVLSKGFHGDKRLGLQGNEFIKDKPVNIIDSEKIDNVYEELKKTNVLMVKFENKNELF